MSSEKKNRSMDRDAEMISAGKVGVLIVDDSPQVLSRCQGLILRKLTLQFPGLFVETAANIEEVLKKDMSKIQVIVLDQFFENNSKFKNGIDSIPTIKSNSAAAIIVHTASGKISDAVRAIKYGATNYVFKGEDTSGEILTNNIARALISQKMAEENEILLRGGIPAGTEAPDSAFTYKSSSMRQALSNIERIAKSDYPVLLLGESGVGKSHIAREIHRMRGCPGAFIEINVCAPSMNVIEAELFGSVKGAFTDAVNKEGLFKLASGGTLFLDEIGEAPLELQNKILTAIETKTFSKVGAPHQKITVDFKLITATNKNPAKLIEERKLKGDFYARIRGYELTIPSLADRREDIPDLIRNILPKAAKKTHTPVLYRHIPRDFIEWIRDNPPKFNVRELEDLLKDLLTYAPIDSETGRLIFKDWQELKPFRALIAFARKSTEELTWHDIFSDEMKLLTDDFPGFKEFCLKVEQKIIREGSKQFATTTDLAKFSGVSRSTLFRRGLSKDLMRVKP